VGAELQEVLALAIVALVAGGALLARLRSPRRGGSCHGCASGCGTESRRQEPLTQIRKLG
jgi:hypothetical protein